MKWLIINGDDFGASRGINRGIIQAHHDGILTSASLLVNRPASIEAAAFARQHPGLSLGLHLELDAGRPGREGSRRSMRAPAGAVRELTGERPTHVDSHHDVHRDPHVLPHVLALAPASPARRCGSLRGPPPREILRPLGRRHHPEQIGVEGLLRLLDAEVREGVTELSCHPGYVEPGYRSSYLVERELELRTLCDPRVRQAIRDRGDPLDGIPGPAGARAAATLTAEAT